MLLRSTRPNTFVTCPYSMNMAPLRLPTLVTNKPLASFRSLRTDRPIFLVTCQHPLSSFLRSCLPLLCWFWKLSYFSIFVSHLDKFRCFAMLAISFIRLCQLPDSCRRSSVIPLLALILTWFLQVPLLLHCTTTWMLWTLLLSTLLCYETRLLL